MKKLFIIFLTAVIMLSIASCGEKFESAEDYANRIYTYEGKVSGGEFSITLNEDGTFSYYEGFFSSYIGFGEWSADGDIITIADDPDIGYEFVNRFRMSDGDLVFIAEGSTGFLYVDVTDGERFFGEEYDIPKDIEE